MSAAQKIVEAARHYGGVFTLVGDKLRYRFNRHPPAALVAEMKSHKAELVDFLSHNGASWSADEWRAFYAERAGIREYDGGQARHDAEVTALEDCVAQWLAMSPPAVSEPSAGCLACGQSDDNQNLMPHLTRDGHFWLHARCWDVYLANRRKLAVSGLYMAWPSMPAICPDIKRMIEEATPWSGK
jgi:hypothetical protein